MHIAHMRNINANTALLSRFVHWVYESGVRLLKNERVQLGEAF